MKRLLDILRRAALLPALLLLGAEGDSGGGGGTDTGGDKGGDKGDKGKDGGDAGDKGKQTVTMTQEEFDKIIQSRLAREGKKAVEEYLKGLGMTKEQVEALVKKAKEDEDKAKSDLDKANERAAKAEAEKQAAIAAANAKLAKAAFLVQAVAVGIPADRVEDAAMLAAAQLAELKPDEKTGDFKAEEVKKIAEDLVKAKPWLKGDGKGGNVGGGSNPPPGGPTPEELGKQAAETRNKGPQAPTGGYDPWAKKQ